MPMGVVSDKEFEIERSRLDEVEAPIAIAVPKVIVPEVVIEDIKRGRGEGSVEVPNSLRKLIGDTAITEGRQSALQFAKNLGVSPSSVSAYSNGSTSTASYDEKPNQHTISDAKARVSLRARKKMMMALSHITDDKLGDAKVRDLAGIAKDMSAIVRNMEDNNANGGVANGPNFIFYSPNVRSEDSFQVVQAKE